MSTNTTSSAGGRRFWVVVLCFALANAAVWVGYDRWQKAHRHQLLEVTEFTPGEGATVEGRATLSWSFNLDVVPPEPNAPAPGQITPNVPGKWNWTQPRRLTFSPDVPLPEATSFTARLLPETFHTVDGFYLPKPYVASLQTPSLQVLGVRQAAYENDDRVVIELSFSDKVLPADVIKNLVLRGPDGQDVKFHPHGGVAGKKVRVFTDPITSLLTGQGIPEIIVQVNQGLVGEAGPLGLTHSFLGHISVAAELIATEAQAWYPSHDEAFLQVRFNNEVELEALRQVISVEPSVPFTLVSGFAGVDLHGPFQPGTRYAIKIAKPPAGLSGKCFLVPLRSASWSPIASRECGLKMKWVILAQREIAPSWLMP